MKRYTIAILITLVLVSGVLMGCSEGLQTFSKYGISLTVSKELKLEEYTVSVEDQIFRRGISSYEEGAVISTEKNFMLLWVTAVPEYTQEEIRDSIISTPNTFESAGSNLQAEITSSISTQQIAGFEISFADMLFIMPGWEASGITAVWNCPANHRTIQLILIHNSPQSEMNRFIRSFSCDSIN